MGQLYLSRARSARRGATGAGLFLTALVSVAACSSTSTPPPSLGDTTGDGGGVLTITTRGDSSTGGGTKDATTSSTDGATACGDAGQVMCGTSCVDTASDSNNCGGCDQPCGTGFDCSRGKCVCGGDFTQCGTQCFDLMTSAANCGTCTHNCEGNTCTNGVCGPTGIVMAAGGYIIGSIWVNADDIYWTSPNASSTQLGEVTGQSFANTPGGQTTIPITMVDTQNAPAGITGDNDNLYWVNQSGPAPGYYGSVIEFPLRGGGGWTLTQGDAGQVPIAGPVGIAVDALNVYWTDGVLGTVNQTSIARGGQIYVLAHNRVNPSAIATDGVNVYWTDLGTTVSPGTVNAVPVNGGNVTVISSDEISPLSIVTDGAYVYWTDNANPGSVKRAPISGSVAPTVLATMQPGPWGIALDPPLTDDAGTAVRYVYWTNYDGGDVMKMPSDGSGTSFTLATQQNTPAAIYVDLDRNIYWASGSLIFKLAQ
jgi:hypothetical protein